MAVSGVDTVGALQVSLFIGKCFKVSAQMNTARRVTRRAPSKATLVGLWRTRNWPLRLAFQNCVGVETPMIAVGVVEPLIGDKVALFIFQYIAPHGPSNRIK